ncbi:NAD-dependent epimerase/dehydratase family protein [Actinophytocola oryzae]|uniref:Nucleoside-diphosphate-sugar epimerase n=1 Tax=Actinophytocola oryzae TaxID=502181 RepID=A0A4V3FV05_9PSEU|nr:NAD-dependent epimerase/dehydratase family protein [Actinophytocola oryzae]TDV57251.1 nucleoside-diphosphate-sugar epimerase [Actinophytocola oryzae]
MTVLVTGGTGYVAGWCVKQLLDRGHEVRTTVRSAAKAEAVRRMLDADGRLTFAVADLTGDEGWRAAAEGCSHVLHVASPLGIDTNANGLVGPARDGTLRVLGAAVAAGVSRVVVTSAANAASPSSYRDESVSDETLWTDPADRSLPAYRRSKTLAERAAWEFMADKETELVTVLPGAVFGPVLNPDTLGSVQIVARLLSGMPGTPRIGFEVVDVRDVADIHLRAMTAPAAAGERFLATGEFMWMHDMAMALRAGLGAAASRVPTRTLPNLAVRLASITDPTLREIMPALGRRARHTTAKAERLLGWHPRPGAEAVIACGESLVAHGRLPATR